MVITAYKGLADRAVLERAVMDAVKAIANFQPTEIIGMRADAADAANLANDMRTVADIADGLIHALAVYARGYMDGIDPADCKNICRNAIDDNGAIFLDCAANRLREDQYGAHHDFQRSARA
jgi:hypothetical protein